MQVLLGGRGGLTSKVRGSTHVGETDDLMHWKNGFTSYYHDGMEKHISTCSFDFLPCFTPRKTTCFVPPNITQQRVGD